MDAKSPASAFAQTLVSRVGILLINLGTGVIVARSLGPDGRGAAAAVSLWPIVLCGISTLGIPTALRYHIRRNPSSADHLFSSAIGLAIGSGVVAMCTGFFAVPHLLNRYPDSMIRFATMMLLFAPQIMCNNVLQGFLEARGDFKRSNTMQYFPPATTLLALVVLRGIHELTPYSVPLAYFIPTVFVTIAVAWSQRRSWRFPLDFFQQSRVLLDYGLRVYGLNILTTLSGQLDQAIIVGFMSAESFGLYGVALNISTILGVFAASLNVVLFPNAAELHPTEAIRVVCRSARMILVISLAAYLAALSVLPALIYTIYGKAFAPDIELTRILMVEVVLASLGATLSQAFMATGRPGIITMLQAIGLCVTFPAMLYLIPRFGLVGAAYALVSSTAIRLCVLLLCFPLLLKEAIPRLFPTQGDINELRTRFARLTA